MHGNVCVGAGSRRGLEEGVQCIWVFFHLSVYIQLRRGRWNFSQHSLSLSQGLIYCSWVHLQWEFASCSDSSWPMRACLKFGERALSPVCCRTDWNWQRWTQSRGEATHLCHLKPRASIASWDCYRSSGHPSLLHSPCGLFSLLLNGCYFF